MENKESQTGLSLSFLSCPRPAVRWRWYYCSILAFLFHSCLHTKPLKGVCMDLQYSMGGLGVWRYNISDPELQKLSKELLRRLKSLPCIAYLFIYLILQTFIHPRTGLHRACSLFFQQFPSWHSHSHMHLLVWRSCQEEQTQFGPITKLFQQRNWRLSALLKGTLTLAVEGFGVC